MAAIIGSLVLRYNIKPNEVFYIDKENFIEDGSFENFNQTPGDCCNGNPGNASIFASKSTDSLKGEYSLKLESSNHCACIAKNIIDLTNTKKYLLSFYYKGKNAKICNWIIGDDLCNPDANLGSSEKWVAYRKLLIFTNKSRDSLINFYANSDGRVTTTNLYDDLQVRKLTQVDPPYPYKPNEQYLIKTDPSNIVHNGEPLNDEEGYYLVTGAPDITLQFPLTELILLLFMMLVVVRLLFKKEIIQTEKTMMRDTRRNI